MVGTMFTTLGIIILAGYIGRMAYDQTKIPESIFMILIGLLVGPTLGVIGTEQLIGIVPFFSILALLIVLLDCGLSFNIFSVLKHFPKALGFTLTISVLSTLSIGGMLYTVFGWTLPAALLLGLIASGTTTITAMTLLLRLPVSEKTKNILFLETMINDFTLIFGASIIVLVMKQQVRTDLFSAIILSISMGIFFGVIAGFAWVGFLEKMSFKKLNYVSTLGAIFLLYGATESLNGSGLIAAMTFSIILGNYPILHQRFVDEAHAPHAPSKAILKSMRFVQEDISFVVKVFFFVLIGVLFDASTISTETITITLSILVLILISRFISTKMLCSVDKSFKPYSFVITTMIPRGFIATVLAFISYQEGIAIPSLTEIVLFLVLITNVFAITSSYYYSKYVADETTPIPNKTRR